MMTKDIRDFVVAIQILRDWHRKKVPSTMAPMSFTRDLIREVIYIQCCVQYPSYGILVDIPRARKTQSEHVPQREGFLSL